MSFPRLNSVIYDENGCEFFLGADVIVDYDDSEFDDILDAELQDDPFALTVRSDPGDVGR